MSEQKNPIPTRVPTDEESRAELALVLERVMYVMRWIADTPHHLIDGQHHQVLRDAVSELTHRFEKEGGLNGLLSQPNLDLRKIREALENHGLTGAAWALKFEAFDRHFRGFRDRVALLEARYDTLGARLLEVANANLNVVDLRRRAEGSLGIGATIAESAADALSEIPGAKALFGTVKEAAGAVKSLFRD